MSPARVTGSRKSAIAMVLLMVLMSQVPILSSQSTGRQAGGASWALEGSEDTGWVLLETTGANPERNHPGFANWELKFPPGAHISNVTLEVSVDGDDGVKILDPELYSPDTQYSFFDWSNLGGFGYQNGFLTGEEHVGRLTPNSDIEAMYRLPAGAEITDLVLEALKPVDPAVSFIPLYLDIVDSEVDPADGRLYIAVGDVVLQLDHHIDPKVIHLRENMTASDIHIDPSMQRLLIVQSDGISAYDLDDGVYLGDLPAHPGSAGPNGNVGAFTHVWSTGSDLYAVSPAGLFRLNAAGSAWTSEQVSGTSNWPDGEPMDVELASGVLYVSLMGGGVARWNTASFSVMSPFQATAGGDFTSNNVHEMVVNSDMLYIASMDAGLFRYSHVQTAWMSPWTHNNWLDDNLVIDIAAIDDTVFILGPDTLHNFDVNLGLITSDYDVKLDLGLTRQAVDIIPWTANGGARSPPSSIALLGDGTGMFSVLDPSSQVLYTTDLELASGPSGMDMSNVVQIHDEVFVASGDLIDVFNSTAWRWTDPLTGFGQGIVSMVTDGSLIYLATESPASILELHPDGTWLRIWGGVDLAQDEVLDLAYDNTGYLVATHLGEVTVIDLITGGSSYYTWDVGRFNDVVTRDGIAYLATNGAGVLRLELATGDNLSPWQSTGLDDLERIPIAAGNGMIYLGVPTIGVMIFDQSTSELVNTWEHQQGGGPGGGGGGDLPGDSVTALHVDTDGYVWVGTPGGAVRYDGQQFDDLPFNGEWWEEGFVDFDSDSTDVWAAMSGNEICRWDRQTLSGGQDSDCFDSDDGLPEGDDGYWDYLKVRFIGTNELMLTTINGAATFDTGSMQVLQVWETNAASEDAPVIQFGDVIYLALNGDGVARYDTTANQWLSSWDSSNLLPTDGVTALALDSARTTLWVGGDFGLIDIELQTSTAGNTFTLASPQPQSLIIDDDILYYVPAQDENDDDIQRMDLATNTILEPIDVGAEFGGNAYIHGADIVDGTLLLGTSEAEWRWWVGYDEGRILRYNISSDAWDNSWEPSAYVGRVTTAYIGGHIYIAYGNDVIRELNSNGFLLNEWIDHLDGPIRNIIEYNGEVLFGTVEGIARYDPINQVWLTTWTPSNGGMHPDSDEEITAMVVEGGDLWYASGIHSGGWWGSQGSIQRNQGIDANGDGNIDGDDHDYWEAGMQGVPDGDFWDLEACGGYMHVATRWNGQWGNGGGVGRFNLANDSWSNNVWTNGNGLSDDDAIGLACDSHDIIYIGYEEFGNGFSRYDYGNGNWLRKLMAGDGISEDPVWWGTMEWMNGELIVGHSLEDGSSGGFSTIQTNGAATSNGAILSQGTEVSSITPVSNAPFGSGFIIGRPGNSQGNSAVDWYSAGLVNYAYFGSMVGFTTGTIEEFEGNSTHVYIVPADDRFANKGASILEGQYTQNGTVVWTRGWSFGWDGIKDILFDGSYVWVTTDGLGLWYIDVSSGAMTRVSASLTTTMDGLSMEGSSLAVGLTGSGASVPGAQILNTNSMQWEAGGLVPGLPSNIILDAVEHQGKTWFATLNGVGIWNNTAGNWEQALTVANGLPTPVIEKFYIHSNGELWMATPIGIVRYDPLTGLYQPNIDRLDGLIGNRVNDIAEDNGKLFLSHNGAGRTRPGLSAYDLATDSVEFTVALDQIPSNNVLALSADSWGVHIATDADPLVHYNAADNEFEEGITSWQVGVWPAMEMVSNGHDLFILFSDRVIRVDVTGVTHSTRNGWPVDGGLSLSLGSLGLFAAGGEGMYGWSSAPSYAPMDRFQLRYADPLLISFAGVSMDISDMTHPGQSVVLASSSNTLLTDETTGSNDVATMIYADLAVALTSPVAHAPTYLRSQEVLYQGEWNLSKTNADIGFELQKVLDNAVISAQGMDVELRLKSAGNGSMMVRLTYDWVRIQTPVEVIDLVDRPEDGGGYLTASWSASPDPDFHAYHLYLVLTDQVDLDALAALPPDAISAAWGRTSLDIGLSMGAPLLDGEEYWAVIIVEYTDGSLGEASNIFGPAIPFDDVPSAPAWGVAGPADDGVDGDLSVEWSRCKAIDLSLTRIHIYTQPVTDALALTDKVDVDGDLPNMTTLELEAGRPYWLALTCVDMAGQEDIANPLILGPVVPAGGINDGVPPPKILGVDAFDTPDDEGGRVTVEWNPSIADDCSFTTIYVMDSELWMGLDINTSTGQEVRTDAPLTATHFGIGAIITDCSTNSTIITSVDGQPLIDGNLYYVAVVASDKWLNEDLLDVDIVEVTPYRQQDAGSQPPERVGFLDAWDKADDDGTAIQVSWLPSGANDFAYYIVWANSEPVTNLQSLWSEVGDDQINCGCIRINQQYFGSADDVIEITVDRARYGPAGSPLTSDDVMQKGIIAGAPLFVTVTIHDVKGNVWLTELSMVETIPINNIDDHIPPALIQVLEVEDWPDDDGSAVSLEFERSPESDISQYAIYASSERFTKVGFGGPPEPVVFLERDLEMPIEIDHLSNGDAIISEMTVWVGVVAIDSAGNSMTTGLYVESAVAKDNRGDDPGAYLPDVENVRASWILSGNAIMIEWDAMDNADLDHLEIYISNENWQTTLQATHVASVEISEEAFVMLELNGEPIDNMSDWYIGISAADEITHRFMVELVHVNAYGSVGGEGQSQDTAPEWQALVSNSSIWLTILLMLAISVVLFMIVRSRRHKGDAQWQFEGTWGIKSNEEPTDLWGDTPLPDQPHGTSIPLEAMVSAPAATTKQDPAAQEMYHPPSSAVATKSIQALESELGEEQQQTQTNIDTSFLDDLL